MLVTELDYNKMYMNAFNDGFNQGLAVEREKVLDECKSIILQTIDNEMLIDTLFLRIDELKKQK